VAGPPDDDDDGDFSIQLAPYPKAANPTMELETSDLANMAQSGVAETKPNLVIQLDTGQTVELAPGWSQGHATSNAAAAAMPSIIVEADIVPPPLPQVAPAAPRPRAAPAPRRSGTWLVVLLYLLSAAALALALYERFGWPP
jgi:hypothetical protein